MNLSQRINLLTRLGDYLQSNDPAWEAVKEKAFVQNAWFLPAFINKAVHSIAHQFLTAPVLHHWAKQYPRLHEEHASPKRVGIVMAGNIPLVGFHDWLCVFITGNISVVKPSSKDEVLIKHLVEKLTAWEPSVATLVYFENMLKGCDAYIATGSNNTAGYFDYYFGKYPHLIRRNRTSVAILQGHEDAAALTALADDVHAYFGMGCRNVTKIYVPKGYNFEPLLQAFSKYDYLADAHKYKNNYDYNLALLLLNNTFYMSSASLLLTQSDSLFSPVSQLHYAFYEEEDAVFAALKNNTEVQCIVGTKYIPFGAAQSPAIDQYADGEDTMQFLTAQL